MEEAKAFFAEVARLDAEKVDPDRIESLLNKLGRLPLAVMLAAHMVADGQSVEEIRNSWNRLKMKLYGSTTVLLAQHILGLSVILSIEAPRMAANSNALCLLQILAQLPDGLFAYSFEQIELFTLEEKLIARDTLCGVGLAFKDANNTLRTFPSIRSHMMTSYSPNPDDLTQLYVHYLNFVALAGQAIYCEDEHASKICEQIQPEMGNVQSVLLKMTTKATDATFSHCASAILGWCGFLHWRHLPSAYILMYILTDWKQRLSLSHQAAYLHMLGTAEHVHGKYTEANEVLNEARKLYNELGERVGEATCQWMLGDIIRVQGKTEQAIQTVMTSLAIYKEIPDSELSWSLAAGKSKCLWSLGHILLISGELDAATKVTQEALNDDLSVALIAGESSRLSHELLQQAIAIDKGDYTTAEVVLRGILSRAKNLNDGQNMSAAILFLSDVCYRLGQFSKGRSYAKHAHALFVLQGAKQGIADCQRILGCITAAQGGPAAIRKAEEHLEDAMKIYEELGDQIHIADVTLARAQLTLELLEIGGVRPNCNLSEAAESVVLHSTAIEDAYRLARKALSLHTELDCQRGVASCSFLLAKVCSIRGLEDEMQGHAQLAMETFACLQNKTGVQLCEEFLLGCEGEEPEQVQASEPMVSK
jgi:tetratricopeptide (TPR) repeat protein